MKPKPPRPTIADNPHLPRPIETWLNRHMMCSAVKCAFKRLGADPASRLRKWMTREDIEQEAYLIMWHAAPLYNPAKGKLTTFLFQAVWRQLFKVAYDNSFVRIPMHASCNNSKTPHLVEARKRLGVVHHQDDEKFPLSEVPEQRYEDSEETLIIRELLSQPALNRDILIDFYIYGLTSTEISAKTGISWRCVFERKTRALAQLRKRLIERYPSLGEAS